MRAAFGPLPHFVRALPSATAQRPTQHLSDVAVLRPLVWLLSLLGSHRAEAATIRSGPAFPLWLALAIEESAYGSHGRARLLLHQPMPGTGDHHLLLIGRGEAHHRRHSRAERLLPADRQHRHAKRSPDAADWATRLLTRRPFKVAAVALANKMARVAWALLVRGGTYNTAATAA